MTCHTEQNSVIFGVQREIIPRARSHALSTPQMPTSIQLLSLALPAAYAGVSGTLFSKDLISTPGFDNVKAVWDSDLDIGGSSAKLSLLYDMKAKKDFFKEAKLAGALADLKYTVTYGIGSGVAGITLMSKQAGHHMLKAVGDTKAMLTSVSAKGSQSVAGKSIGYEPAYMIKSGLSKLTLSTVVGGGVSAKGVVGVTSGGDVSTDYSVAYDMALGAVSAPGFANK